ncbi:hypothetical protein ACN47E_004110 [Coniothyrium glycines]
MKSDSAAQFQEPPIATPSSNTITPISNTSEQFQEPIQSQAAASSGSAGKSTTEKIKDVVKRPFVKEEEVKKIPELEATREVIEAKGLV